MRMVEKILLCLFVLWAVIGNGNGLEESRISDVMKKLSEWVQSTRRAESKLKVDENTKWKNRANNRRRDQVQPISPSIQNCLDLVMEDLKKELARQRTWVAKIDSPEAYEFISYGFRISRKKRSNSNSNRVRVGRPIASQRRRNDQTSSKQSKFSLLKNPTKDAANSGKYVRVSSLNIGGTREKTAESGARRRRPSTNPVTHNNKPTSKRKKRPVAAASMEVEISDMLEKLNEPNEDSDTKRFEDYVQFTNMGDVFLTEFTVENQGGIVKIMFTFQVGNPGWIVPASVHQPRTTRVEYSPEFVTELNIKATSRGTIVALKDLKQKRPNVWDFYLSSEIRNVNRIRIKEDLVKFVEENLNLEGKMMAKMNYIIQRSQIQRSFLQHFSLLPE